MDSFMFKFFGAGSDYDLNQNNLSNYQSFILEFGKYLGCRFEKDNFDDYMKCIGYWSWDSADFSNYLLPILSGSWYEKFHDVDHKQLDCFNPVKIVINIY